MPIAIADKHMLLSLFVESAGKRYADGSHEGTVKWPPSPPPPSPPPGASAAQYNNFISYLKQRVHGKAQTGPQRRRTTKPSTSLNCDNAASCQLILGVAIEHSTCCIREPGAAMIEGTYGTHQSYCCVSCWITRAIHVRRAGSPGKNRLRYNVNVDKVAPQSPLVP